MTVPGRRPARDLGLHLLLASHRRDARRRGLISCLRDAPSGRILETIPRGAQCTPPALARLLPLPPQLAPPASRLPPQPGERPGSREPGGVGSHLLGEVGRGVALRVGAGKGLGCGACGVTMKDWGTGLQEWGAEPTSRCTAPRGNLGVVAFERPRSWVQVGRGTCGALLSRPRLPRTARPLDLWGRTGSCGRSASLRSLKAPLLNSWAFPLLPN